MTQLGDGFKLIEITCQVACHAKLNTAYLSSLKPNKTAVVLTAGVTISGPP